MNLDDFKWKHFFICVAIIITGVLAAISIAGIINERGRILGGGIDVEFVYSMEHFSYDSKGIVLTQNKDNPNLYEYNVDLIKVTDFDGQKNAYQFYINDLLGYSTEVYAGKIITQFTIDFINTDGSHALTSTIFVTVEFFTNRTALTVQCQDGAIAVDYWTRFFQDLNFRLRAETMKEV